MHSSAVQGWRFRRVGHGVDDKAASWFSAWVTGSVELSVQRRSGTWPYALALLAGQGCRPPG